MDSEIGEQKLATVQDVPEGGSIIVNAGEGKQIALFKVNGKIFALNNACPHMEGPLGEGEIEGGIVTCPWHGWQFEICSGSCVNMPGEDAVKVPITIRGQEIFLDRHK